MEELTGTTGRKWREACAADTLASQGAEDSRVKAECTSWLLERERPVPQTL